MFSQINITEIWKPKYTIQDGIEELMSAYQMIITDNNKKYTNL